MNATEGRDRRGALRDFVLRPSRSGSAAMPGPGMAQRLRQGVQESLRLVGVGYAASLLLLLPAGAA